MKEHKSGEKSWPSDKALLLKLEHNSAIVLHAITDGYNIDYDNTRIHQLGFRTCTELMYAEAMAICTHSKFVNQNDEHKFGDMDSSKILDEQTVQRSSRKLNSPPSRRMTWDITNLMLVTYCNLHKQTHTRTHKKKQAILHPLVREY